MYQNGQGLGRGGRKAGKGEAFCVVRETVRKRKPETN